MLTKNYSTIESRNNLSYIFLPGVASLSRIGFFEREFGKNIIFITFCNTTYKTISTLSLKAILCPLFERSPNTNRYSILKRLNSRWEYNKSILESLNDEIIDNSCFIFFIIIIDYWGVLIAKFLSKNNRKVGLIYIDNKSNSYNKIAMYHPNNIHSMLVDSIAYKLPLRWLKDKNGLGTYLGVTNAFLINNIKLISFHDNDLELERSSASRAIVKQERVIDRLILGGYSIDGEKEFYCTDDVVNIYKETKEMYPNTFHKYHPGKILKDTLSDSFLQIDHEEPIEYINLEVRVVIASFSLTLVSMSLRGVTCVSYMKLVKYKKGFDGDAIVKKMLKQSNNKIHFPETISEYLELIK